MSDLLIEILLKVDNTNGEIKLMLIVLEEEFSGVIGNAPIQIVNIMIKPVFMILLLNLLHAPRNVSFAAIGFITLVKHVLILKKFKDKVNLHCNQVKPH